MKNLKLMADYQCFPIWGDAGDGIGNIDPSSLPISEDLVVRLNAWAAKYDQTLNPDDPLHSGFKSDALEQAFREEGRRLCQALQTELGNGYLVGYQE